MGTLTGENPLLLSPMNFQASTEPYMKHTITKLEEEKELENFVLENYLMELELRHLASEEASNRMTPIIHGDSNFSKIKLH